MKLLRPISFILLLGFARLGAAEVAMPLTELSAGMYRIEAEVAASGDVFLYTVDDLAKVVDSGLESRQAAVIEAEGIIDERVDGFLHWLDSRGTVPTIRALREHADALRRAELEQIGRAHV